MWVSSPRGSASRWIVRLGPGVSGSSQWLDHPVGVATTFSLDAAGRRPTQTTSGGATGRSAQFTEEFQASATDVLVPRVSCSLRATAQPH